MKTGNWVPYLILVLVIVGVSFAFKESPMTIIIPVVVFGLIFYWYKKPPAFLSKGQRTNRSYRTAAAKTNKAKKERPRSKTVPFKVIEGGRDDNDTPRYH